MPHTNASSTKGGYSSVVLCHQLHALYDLLKKRRQEILEDPDFNPGNESLNLELERIDRRVGLIRECFEEFCPS